MTAARNNCHCTVQVFTVVRGSAYATSSVTWIANFFSGRQALPRVVLHRSSSLWWWGRLHDSHLPNKAITGLSKSDNRRSRATTLRVGNDGRLATFHGGHGGVGSA